MSDHTGVWRTAGLSGVVGIHAALLHTGQVLFYARPENPPHKKQGQENGLRDDDPSVTLSTIIDLEGPDAFAPRPVQVAENPFCSGLTLLPDGRVFVAGGDKKCHPIYEAYKIPSATRFDGRYSLRTFMPGSGQPGSHGQWRRLPEEMNDARWYPSCVLLADGRVLIISGYLDDMVAENNQNPTCELWPPLAGGPQYLPALVEAWPHDAYPFVFSLPDGSVFMFAKDRAYKLRLQKDPFGNERWTVRKGAKLPLTEDQLEEPAKQYPNTATAVLLPLLPANAYAAEVLIMGGGGHNVHTHWGKIPSTGQDTHDVDASDACFRMRADTSPDGPWQKSRMNYKRVMPDSVLLPDGTVLVVNGVSKGFAGGDPATGPIRPANAVTVADLYDPVANYWRALAESPITRLYHSTALLLPDATVMVAGSDHQSHGDRDEDKVQAYEFRIEVFEPPYLFNGADRAVRPVYHPEEKALRYGQQFSIQVEGLAGLSDSELQAAFLRPGAVTHSNNMSQRHVGLRIIGRLDDRLTLEAPPNSNVAPPGYYMLFLLHRGVPSKAHFFHLVQEAADEPASPAVSTEGMTLWLRGDTGVEADDRGFVSAWCDASGRGNDMIVRKDANGDSHLRPPRCIQQELNGQAVVRFSFIYNTMATPIPCGSWLESINGPFMPGASPYSVFCVTHPWPPGFRINVQRVRDDGSTTGVDVGWADLLGWGDYTIPAANAFVGLRIGSSPAIHPDSALPKHPGKAVILNYWNTGWEYGHQDKAHPESDPLVPLTVPVLVEMFYDGWQTGIRLNGVEIKRDSAPEGGRRTGDGPLTIGLNSGMRYRAAPRSDFKGSGAFFRGDIAEVIIYERFVDGHERYEIQEYLRSKYALW